MLAEGVSCLTVCLQVLWGRHTRLHPPGESSHGVWGHEWDSGSGYPMRVAMQGDSGIGSGAGLSLLEPWLSRAASPHPPVLQCLLHHAEGPGLSG